MDQLNWKSRLVVLWIFQVLNFIAVLVIPASIAAVSAEVGDALGPLIVFYFVLTCAMLWLTLVAKPTVTRWLAILVGIFFAFVKVQWIINSLSGDTIVEMFLNEVWGLVAALMLVWYGWKAPSDNSAGS